MLPLAQSPNTPQVIFNEGWGQWDGAPEGRLTDVVRGIDSSRLINSVSGWNDHGYGDYVSLA
jgi:hypothetical protein